MVNQIVASGIFIKLGVESWLLINTPRQINKKKKRKINVTKAKET